MKKDYKNITDIAFDGIDHSDAPEYTDAHIVSAKCNGKELTQDEIYELNDDRDFVYEELTNFLN